MNGKHEEPLSLLPIAARVLIGESFDIAGAVTAINIRPGIRIEYEVTWWNDGTKHEGWFDTFEVKAKDGKQGRLLIGFQG